MKKQIIAAALAVAVVAGGVPASMKLQNEFAVEAAKKKTPSVKKIRNAVAKAYGENYLATMSLTTDDINAFFGLDSSWYKAAAADIPMMSAHIDKFVAVRAKNKKTKKLIKAKLQEYLDTQVNDAMQYPSNLLKYQAARIYTKDNYVFLIALGSIDMTLQETATEEEQIEAYKEQNQIAVDTIKKLFKK